MKKAKIKILGTLLIVGMTNSLSLSAASAFDWRDGLGKVPINTLMTKQAFSAHVIDLHALRARAQADRVPLKQMGREGSGLGADAVIASFGDEATWTRYTGLPANQPAALTVYPSTAPNTNVTIWQFARKDQADAFLKGLPGLGFAAADGLWSNGEPLKMDLSKRDPFNPFTGPVGFTSVVAQLDDGIVQSRDPQAVRNGVGMTKQNSLVSLPSVVAALDAMDKAASGGIMPQVYVISPFMWVSGSSDMAKILQDNLSRSQSLQLPPSAASGVPPSIGALLVDVEMVDPPRRGVLVVLPYDNCRTAGNAAAAFADRWKNTPNQYNATASAATGVDATTSEIEGRDSCTAVISLLAPSSRASTAVDPASGGNPILRYILYAIDNRDFAPLQGN